MFFPAVCWLLRGAVYHSHIIWEGETTSPSSEGKNLLPRGIKSSWDDKKEKKRLPYRRHYGVALASAQRRFKIFSEKSRRMYDRTSSCLFVDITKEIFTFLMVWMAARLLVWFLARFGVTATLPRWASAPDQGLLRPHTAAATRNSYKCMMFGFDGSQAWTNAKN